MDNENNTQIDSVLLDFSKANDEVPHIEVALQAPSLWCTRTPTQVDPEFPVGSNAESTGQGPFSLTAQVTSKVIKVHSSVLYYSWRKKITCQSESTQAPVCLRTTTCCTRAENRDRREITPRWPQRPSARGTKLGKTFQSRVHPYFHHTEAKHYSILLSWKGIGCHHRGQVPRVYMYHAYQTICHGITTHINSVCKKANNNTALIFMKKSFYIFNLHILTLVRTQLEYASAVWDPHTRKNMNKKKGS